MGKVQKRELTEAELEHALAITANGATIAQISASLGLTPYAFRRYCTEYPIFGRLFEEHRELGFLARAEALPETIRFGLFQDSQHLRTFVDTEKWLLSKMHSKLFGDRQTITHEYVDVSGALVAARKRAKIIDVTPQAPQISNPFE